MKLWEKQLESYFLELKLTSNRVTPQWSPLIYFEVLEIFKSTESSQKKEFDHRALGEPLIHQMNLPNQMFCSIDECKTSDLTGFFQSQQRRRSSFKTRAVQRRLESQFFLQTLFLLRPKHWDLLQEQLNYVLLLPSKHFINLQESQFLLRS